MMWSKRINSINMRALRLWSSKHMALYCCISPSDWCSLSSLNFIHFIFLSPVHAYGSCEAGDCLFLNTHQSAPLQAQEMISGQGVLQPQVGGVQRHPHLLGFPIFPSKHNLFFRGVLFRSHKSDDI